MIQRLASILLALSFSAGAQPLNVLVFSKTAGFRYEGGRVFQTPWGIRSKATRILFLSPTSKAPSAGPRARLNKCRLIETECAEVRLLEVLQELEDQA
ncbi:MAG: hypothetical protein A2W03_06005 [Candidatus Aminicenantes bacterium RBG_16_63_16]|nr:MAG: hypothetical protein A2W03_06005 [Candidatus Aminicenantes bacterium RBG_16_63_16]